MSRKVSKVVIPVAGMGTRFLPATKVLPKELLPIINIPIIHLIVEEAVSAGLETVVFITSRPKVLIEDYFDPADLTTLKLGAAGTEKLIERVLELKKKIDIICVRQYTPRGLGHAVLQSKKVVSGQPFAVVLGDDIMVHDKRSAIGQCLDLFETKASGSVVGVIEVPEAEASKYGVAEFDAQGQVSRFVEKPQKGESSSRWALPGRYVFESEIIDILENTAPGKNNEIQLTDAMQALNKKSPFWADKIQGERFDTGDKLGYIMANVAFALKDPEYREELHDWLKKKIAP
jgi:UTP--glucose-1-phosphate uridylyltransferase